MTILAVITARGGSKGIPQKNVKKFFGKPLVYWTIKAALESSYIDRAIVSTDDPNIAGISAKCGAEIPFLRPKRLAQDNTPTIDVVLHLLREFRKKEKYIPDFVMVLQPTSPLRTSEDIDGAVRILVSSKRADAIVGVTEVSENPYWMKVVTGDKFLRDFLTRSKKIKRRQDLPKIYSTNGAIYICRTDVLLRGKTFYPANAIGYIMPKERSIDIDDIIDFHLAELLAARRTGRDKI